MERAVVVGNCQAKGLELALSTYGAFAERFEFVSFPPVHEIPEEMVPTLHEQVSNAGVVILQRVDDGYRDGLGLGTNTLATLARTDNVIRWPSVFWAGYFPDLFYFRDRDNQPVVDGPFDYHDREILRAYVDGCSVESTCKVLADEDRPSNVLEVSAQATAELAIRGQECDIDVSNLIESRFREELLFFTMNHPANRILEFMAEQVIGLLELSTARDAALLPKDLLGSTFYPFHANHIKALDLAFANQVKVGSIPFKIRGVEYDTFGAVGAFFDYYSQHEGLLDMNLDKK